VSVLALVTVIAEIGFQALLEPLIGLPSTRAASWIFGVLTDAFYGVVVVVTYYDLRAAKEGIDIEQIIAVFD